MIEKLSVDEAAAAAPATEDPSRPFVHRWIRLISVTNWEKGRIIVEWRTALEVESGTVSAYSDEAWAERVGNVTGQHVGRLRRTYERFGEVYAEYPGLFWSHFQAALDWDDAEMWLEGAVQNDWSISQMRAKRSETLGDPESAKPSDDGMSGADIDEDASSITDEGITPIAGKVREVGDVEDDHRDRKSAEESPFDTDDHHSGGESDSTQPATAKTARSRPFENLPKLPDDVAEAFEQFKLAILTHKMMGWTEISRDDMVSCLGALEALALQPAEA